MSTGEVIQLHVGQAGIQMANACWELYCLEHGINLNGQTMRLDQDINTFFSTSMEGGVSPRVVMVDTEPGVIDKVRNGPFQNLFNPNTLISGSEDTGNNFARGYLMAADELIDKTSEAIRVHAEQCSRLEGFLMFRSMGGGTGSGLGAKMLERLVTDYGTKATRMEFCIHPSPSISPVILEPYNSILAIHAGMEFVDCSFLIDNEALYEICENKLDIDSPTYTNLNRIIGQVVSSFTASLRFEGVINVSLAEFQTNLVPFERIHFPLISYAPLVPITRIGKENITDKSITNDIFLRGNQLMKLNPLDGQYMSCVLLYRGDVSMSDVNHYVNEIKSRMGNLVSWSPTGFKIGLNNMPPTCIPWGDLMPTPRAVCMLSNNTAIKTSMCKIMKKFKIMLDKKAFLYHYVSEGMDEQSLKNAGDNICKLIEGYREVEQLNKTATTATTATGGNSVDDSNIDSKESDHSMITLH